MPISASPASCMTALTSAKSRLMTPGLTIRSAMPCTPWRSTSSAIRKASSRVVLCVATCDSRSLGMTISASTLSRRILMPSSAVSLRTLPSQEKGRVTTPMVRAPDSLATSAITGAEPVPVPPPMPAVMKTMSVSWTTSASSVRLSSAASRPRVQSPPEPRPRVSLRPMLTRMSAWQRSSAWTSVLTATKSTPFRDAEIMRLTALPPPPPAPMTLIRARPFSMSAFMSPSCVGIRKLYWDDASEIRLEEVTQPPHGFLVRGAEGGVLAPVVAGLEAGSPLDEAGGDRERRPAGAVRQPREPVRQAQADRSVEDRLGGVGGAHQARPAAGDHDPGRQEAVVPALADLVMGQHEDLAHPGPDDLGQEAPRHGLQAVAAHLVHLDPLLGSDRLRQRMPVVQLQRLGGGQGRAQPDRDVAGDVIAAHRQHRQVQRRTLAEDHHVGGAGADVDQADPQVHLLGREHALGRRQSLADHVLDVVAGAVHTLDHVVNRGLGAGDDVGLHRQGLARHFLPFLDADQGV